MPLGSRPICYHLKVLSNVQTNSVHLHLGSYKISTVCQVGPFIRLQLSSGCELDPSELQPHPVPSTLPSHESNATMLLAQNFFFSGWHPESTRSTYSRDTRENNVTCRCRLVRQNQAPLPDDSPRSLEGGTRAPLDAARELAFPRCSRCRCGFGHGRRLGKPTPS